MIIYKDDGQDTDEAGSLEINRPVNPTKGGGNGKIIHGGEQGNAPQVSGEKGTKK